MSEERTPRGQVARASITIDAPSARVWDALTNPDMIKRYMFGVDARSDWQEGSPLVLRGVWEGKPYEDKGTVLRVEEGHLLEYTHFSPLSGVDDVPENYHTITVELASDDGRTVVTLAQDNNATDEEREHSATMWATMLGTLKDVLEE
jgi:uncharacterized protein YndB with AHSA1/START domain